MTDLDVYQLKAEIEPKLRKGHVTSRILLGHSRFIDDSSTKASAFNDPSHFPFYYHLGNLVSAKSLVEIGVGLGLRAASFVQGCQCEEFLGLQVSCNDQFYGTRLATGNVKDHSHRFARINIHHGLITDPDFVYRFDASKWDVALISEESSYEQHLVYLDSLWERVRMGGLIVVDYQTRHDPSRKALEDFCKVRNRDPVVVGTRYGVSLVQK
jgi:predicted O-methyltransferase YrrM